MSSISDHGHQHHHHHHHHGHGGCQERTRRRHMLVYARKTHERQVFMDELHQYRKARDRQMLKSLVDDVGPKWYQALSVRQRKALDLLESSIYQDLLEARPHRTACIMRELGLVPRPSHSELMNCIYLGRHDPKEMLAQLYLSTYGYPIEGKRASYCLNARLILSAILYLGLDNLIELLKQRFTPEESTEATPKRPKQKPKEVSTSPYLQKLVATMYVPPTIKRPAPLPMPPLDDLNDPYEEEPIMQKPPPPPPPPPPPKKRLPRSYCDKIAGVISIVPHSSLQNVSSKKNIRASMRRLRSSKLNLSDAGIKKKHYGLDFATRRKPVRRRKPVAPSTGLWNYQYTINGVYIVHGKTLFVLGNISTLPAQGEYIHGGHTECNGNIINIHCGFRGWPPSSKPDPCDCVKTWHDTVFNYIKDHKCYCGHHYDFRNEGPFPVDELPYFIKPTPNAPFRFDYQTIYDTDDRSLLVRKEFKKFWETDSIVHIDDKVPLKKDTGKAKKKKRSSDTCLGTNPKPEDYLKCALRLMRRVNVAARLPDLHLVPELREWMRHRLYGSMTYQEKKDYMRKSTTYWTLITSLTGKGFGHVYPPKDPKYSGVTTWAHKQSLTDKFRVYIRKYRLMMFRHQAYVNNLFWRTMYQAEFPSDTFREIYFSYLNGRVEDLQILHPYSSREAIERKLVMAKRRYICLPPGYEPEE